MSVKRIMAIVVIYLAACCGWWILGTATHLRSTEYGSRLGSQVEKLWGSPLVQEAPSWSVQVPGTDDVRWLMPSSNAIEVNLETDYRKKGLIWYSTYRCAFNGAYTILNPEEVAQKIRFRFDFPAKGATYDKFTVAIDGEPLDTPIDTHEGIQEIIELAPGESKVLQIAYETRGISEWRYRMDPKVGRVKDLNLVMTTDFKNVDYPDGSLSPSIPAEENAEGMTLTWKTTDLITTQDIGIVIPEKLNPGPLTTRITFFAPVCLLFFFVLVATINILHKIDIHPMHYLFVAAGFFAFHLLLAYMAGVVHIQVAFLISAVVSVVLVTGYLSAALRDRFPRKAAAAGQTFFLVLFSYSFFLKGVTGLIVAIGSVVTLAVLMRVTAHVDWSEVFTKPDRKKTPPSPPPLPAEPSDDTLVTST